MHRMILASRELDARQKMMDAAQLISQRLSIPNPIASLHSAGQNRKSEIARLEEIESLAEFMDAVNRALAHDSHSADGAAKKGS